MIDLDVSGAELRAAIDRAGHDEAFLEALPPLDRSGPVRDSVSALTDANGEVRVDVLPLVEAVASPRFAAEVFHWSRRERTYEWFHVLVHEATEETFAVVVDQGRFRCRSIGPMRDAVRWLARQCLPVIRHHGAEPASIRLDSGSFLALAAAADLIRQRRLVASLERTDPAIDHRVTDMELELQLQHGWDAVDADWAVVAARLTGPQEFEGAPSGSPTAALARVGALDDHGEWTPEFLELVVALGALVASTVIVNRGHRTDAQLAIWAGLDAAWTLESTEGEIRLRAADPSSAEQAITELLESDPLPVTGSARRPSTSEAASPPPVGSWFWVDVPADLRDDQGAVVGRLGPGSWFEVVAVAPGLVLTLGPAEITGWVDQRDVRQD